MLNECDFYRAAGEAGVEAAALRAVAEVEAGRQGGILPDGRAVILFEAHIFWRRLRVRGINPEQYAATCGDILAPAWNRRLYRGGAAE